MSAIQRLQAKLFIEVCQTEGVSQRIVAACINTKVASVTKFLTIHAQSAQDPITPAAVTATLAHLGLAATPAREAAIRLIAMAMIRNKDAHGALSVGDVGKGVDDKKFATIMADKLSEKKTHAIRAEYLMTLFQAMNPMYVVDLELLFDEKTISQWADCFHGNTILNPKPDPSKVATAMEAGLNEDEQDLGNGLLYRGKDVVVIGHKNAGEAAAFVEGYFVSLGIATCFRISMTSREGSSGIINGERWYCTWEALGRAWAHFKKSMIKLKPFSRWKGLLLSFHLHIAKEMKAAEKPHMNDFLMELIKDRAFWKGDESKEEIEQDAKRKQAQADMMNQFKQGKYPRLAGKAGVTGQPQLQPAKLGGANAARPCVPFFNPNDVCKSAPGKCKFLHAGAPPTQEMVSAYYKGDVRKGGPVAAPPVLQLGHVPPPGMPPPVFPMGPPQGLIQYKQK